MSASPSIQPEQPCPCNSGQDYADCCAPILTGERVAPTAESLMRARYCAYSLNNAGFLADSWHPSTRPADTDPAEQGLVWQQLDVISCEAGGEDDNQGTVEFIATFKLNGQTNHLHEVSDFLKEDGQWFYVDGKQKKGTTITSAKKIGRNQACLCGSGKKYKRCCGP